MKSMKMLTWGLLALSFALAQPVAAAERGEADRGSERDTGSSVDRDALRDKDDRDPTFVRPTRFVVDPAGTGPRRVGTHNTTTAGGPISEDELSLTCGAGGWLETWLEDSNGNPIPGTYEYYCLPEE